MCHVHEETTVGCLTVVRVPHAVVESPFLQASPSPRVKGHMAK